MESGKSELAFAIAEGAKRMRIVFEGNGVKIWEMLEFCMRMIIGADNVDGLDVPRYRGEL
jgi:hypothetical protein